MIEKQFTVNCGIRILFRKCEIMWWCVIGFGDYFPQATALSSSLLSLTDLHWIRANLSCLRPFCRPGPVSVWSRGLFVLITQRNKDGAETKEGFSTIISPSQENKLAHSEVVSPSRLVSFFFFSVTETHSNKLCSRWWGTDVTLLHNGSTLA